MGWNTSWKKILIQGAHEFLDDISYESIIIKEIYCEIAGAPVLYKVGQ